MNALFAFVKREPVLLTAALAAVVSCFFVPPDAAYLGYLDFRTLALLYALMTVVAGLRKAGVFSSLARALLRRAKTVRSVGALLVGLCFFCSLCITNDVALLTFVPFAVEVLRHAGGPKTVTLRVVLLQTVAANLGSMLTPVGNPQNLHLYSFYQYSLPGFLRTVLPVWLLSLALLSVCCLFLPRAAVGDGGEAPDGEGVRTSAVWVYGLLFAVCLATVLRVLPWTVMLAVLFAVLLGFDRRTLLDADFFLLLTFCAFFVFAGNLARIPAVDGLLQTLLAGRTYLTAVLASQVISNVPAAILLSGFTADANGLLLGVNVGGLGTPIASLASLIGFKLYSASENARKGRFLLEFLLLNLLLLGLLSAFVLLSPIPGGLSSTP